ncbi:hypothetical protein KFK09_006371 [Dendrobium nobile]|uniref:Uncharacterized protein n=1 Tax=Dendrobium nobile TaxID=94219 RepID=A0A8T3BUB7_DENNO|nr:hypothetical protein KFK09_006371 [Dendrobium nobile]
MRNFKLIRRCLVGSYCFCFMYPGLSPGGGRTFHLLYQPWNSHLQQTTASLFSGCLTFTKAGKKRVVAVFSSKTSKADVSHQEQQPTSFFTASVGYRAAVHRPVQ